MLKRYLTKTIENMNQIPEFHYSEDCVLQLIIVSHISLPLNPFSLPEQGHPEQCDQPPVAGELHHHRGPPEDPAHV